MNYHIISLGRDYHGKITDFAEARNSFLADLPDNEWILFLDDDVCAPQILLSFLYSFTPPPEARYYSIRQLNLVNGRYQPLQNPFFTRVLVSNRVRYVGRIHEKIPEKPTGIIDIPLIHNHVSQGYTNPKYYSTLFFRLRLAVKKVKDILLYGHVDPRVL